MMPELPFFFRPAGVHSKPLCAHPAHAALAAGSRAYPLGLPDEDITSGWANVQANNYWSATTYAPNSNNAWVVNLNNGNVNANNKTNNNYVWPVRAGEWFPPRSSPLFQRGGKSSGFFNKAPLPWWEGMKGRGNIVGNYPKFRCFSTPTLSLYPSGHKPHRGGGDCLCSGRNLTASTFPKGGDGAGKSTLFSFEALYSSYLKCRRNKRNTINALKFEINAEENLFDLSEELTNRSYRPARSVCFVVEKPKMREIIAADFRDRVVHHLLTERLELIYEPIFVHDSYACRKGKGLHKAVDRTRAFIRSIGRNGRKRLYYLHLDIRNFFTSIDKDILYRMLEKKVNDEELLWLSKVVIFHNPVENCIIKGDKGLIKRLPPHKSLFHAPAKKGLPVGNLTSQFFANLYLNELDQYVKHTLKCSSYIRYCDDFIMLDSSPERLSEMREKIRDFVSERLNLSLNERYNAVLPVSNGIDFLGYIIRPGYMLVRRRVVNNLKTRLNIFEKRLVSEREGTKLIRYDYELLEKLRSVIASYFGHMKWADTNRLIDSILQRYDFLNEYFFIEKNGNGGFSLKPLYHYSEIFSSVRGQYLYYEQRFRNAVIFFHVGSYYEFYSEPAVHGAAAFPDLKRMKKNKRGAIYGFSVRHEKKYASGVLEKGMSVVIIRETDRYIGRVKERWPVNKMIKSSVNIMEENENEKD